LPGKRHRTRANIYPAEPAHRLQRGLDRQGWGEAKIQERSCLFAKGAIFRQVAPGLAHEPEGRPVQRVSGKRLQEWLGLDCIHRRGDPVFDRGGSVSKSLLT
jgi:hypothetical protein